ncbi:MAG: hypothetical protein ACI89X_003215 [Planctomycetota bacterium]|jgi:hypothetical protein
MDPKPPVNRSESNRQPATATDGHAAAETALEPFTTPADRPTEPQVTGQVAPNGSKHGITPRRVSLDPMRSTDRYRLVHPANTAL